MDREEDLQTSLHQAATVRYGQQRAGEMSRRLDEIAHWLALVGQQPLDLLDEEPDDGR